MYDVIDSSVQTKHYITESIKKLSHMVAMSGLKKTIIHNISTITDFSYAWKAIEDLIPIV
jgi:hypothetical protein